VRLGHTASRRLSSFRNVLGDGRNASMPQQLLAVAREGSRRLLNLVRYEGTARLQALRTGRAFKALRQHLDQQKLPPSHLRRLTVRDIYMSARREYHLDGQLQGNVVLFRATKGRGDLADEPVIEMHDDPMLGWEPRVAGPIDTVDVPGGHASMLQEPNVRTVAERLQDRIDRWLGQAPARREFKATSAVERPPASTGGERAAASA
jgi:thioesterase domain-containing protein